MHIAIAVSPATVEIRIMMMGETEQELIDGKSDKLPGEAYRVFEMTDTLAQSIHDWFQKIGIDRADATRGVMRIGRSIDELMAQYGVIDASPAAQ